MDTPIRIKNHMSLEEVILKMQMTTGSLKLQKWLAIYNAIVDPRPLVEIAMHTGLSEATVWTTIAEYNARGPQSLEGGSKIFEKPWPERRSEPLKMR